ncbi:hypothetical protein L2Y90_06100 [Burkholderia pyrrocinia]|uniref:hypothetical protein n=1 Tax=Burkholderia pyrrocinia TaxID=60550 RepID=UPI00215A8321|nr:hypothetical protein [Burkholderia pyrrocinia]UVE66691.1 hypothetical protein L2Y90_06100 [Burkholderia pyrrocinia]
MPGSTTDMVVSVDHAFAQDRLAKGIELEKSTPKDLDNEFHITFAQKKKNADR